MGYTFNIDIIDEHQMPISRAHLSTVVQPLNTKSALKWLSWSGPPSTDSNRLSCFFVVGGGRRYDKHRHPPNYPLYYWFCNIMRMSLFWFSIFLGGFLIDLNVSMSTKARRFQWSGSSSCQCSKSVRWFRILLCLFEGIGLLIW